MGFHLLRRGSPHSKKKHVEEPLDTVVTKLPKHSIEKVPLAPVSDIKPVEARALAEVRHIKSRIKRRPHHRYFSFDHMKHRWGGIQLPKKEPIMPMTRTEWHKICAQRRKLSPLREDVMYT